MNGGGGMRRGGVGVQEGERQAGSGLRTFSSFKNPIFRLYYIAMLGQMAAMNMQLMTRSLLVLRLTGSGTALGVMALGNALPMLFFSLFGGVLADRVRKKYVLIWGQLASAVVSLGIALILMTGFMSADRPFSWLILVAAGLVQGTIMGLMMPARQAIIPEIVKQSELMNAVSLNTLGMNTLRLFAPAAAGFLIDGFGFHAIYFAMTGLYGLAVFFVTLMPLTGTVSLQGRGGIADVKDGLKYVRGQTSLLLILLVTLMMTVLSMPYMMLLPMFTENIWDVGASGLGILMGVSGLGAMAGSLVLASLPDKKRGLMLLLSGIIMGVALVAFAFSPTFTIALGVIVLVGIGQTGRMTLSNTLLQYYVDDAYRGRVMSLYMMEFGLSSFGVFFAAIMADLVGPQMAVGGLAVLMVILSTLALFLVPRLRRLD
jgi:MFS family permease